MTDAEMMRRCIALSREASRRGEFPLATIISKGGEILRGLRVAAGKERDLDEPESSVVYFWRDEDTGIVHHELLFVGPVAFEAAVTHAKEKAPERSVERIHVKHARQANKPHTKAEPASRKIETSREKRCYEIEEANFGQEEDCRLNLGHGE
jgi:hypothetical protein